MNTRRLILNYNGQWDDLDYIGGSPVGTLVSKELTLTELVEFIYRKVKIDSTRYDIVISTVAYTQKNPRMLQIMSNDDVIFLLLDELHIPEVCIDIVKKVDNNVRDSTRLNLLVVFLLLPSGLDFELVGCQVYMNSD
ncbi:hypothetical protein ACOSP7_007179 [Xanthoceras sorbifolium]